MDQASGNHENDGKTKLQHKARRVIIPLRRSVGDVNPWVFSVL